MNKPLPARLAELERLLIQQAEELRQKDTQLRLIEGEHPVKSSSQEFSVS